MEDIDIVNAHPNYSTGSTYGVRCVGCNVRIEAYEGDYATGWNLHLVRVTRERVAQAIEPDGEDWAKSVAAYKATGYQDDPGDWERMFWEAGRQEAARIARTEAGA